MISAVSIFASHFGAWSISLDGNIQLEVPVSQDGESVWLSANQIAVLFDKDDTNIRKHVNNIFKSSEVDKNNNTQKMRVDGVKQSVSFYSLDVMVKLVMNLLDL